jgi:hypothetical protein
LIPHLRGEHLQEIGVLFLLWSCTPKLDSHPANPAAPLRLMVRRGPGIRVPPAKKAAEKLDGEPL